MYKLSVILLVCHVVPPSCSDMMLTCGKWTPAKMCNIYTDGLPAIFMYFSSWLGLLSGQHYLWNFVEIFDMVLCHTWDFTNIDMSLKAVLAGLCHNVRSHCGLLVDCRLWLHQTLIKTVRGWKVSWDHRHLNSMFFFVLIVCDIFRGILCYFGTCWNFIFAIFFIYVS